MSGLGRSVAGGAGHRGRGHAGVGGVDRWRALQGELRREWLAEHQGDPDVRAARADVVARHAKRDTRGHVIMCTPSEVERAEARERGGEPHSIGKVTYPDLAAARRAERELRALGARPQRAYECDRSSTGHAHLTELGPKPRRDRVGGTS